MTQIKRKPPVFEECPRRPGQGHHWRLDAPAGPISTGYCSCGEERAFANSIVSSSWVTALRQGQTMVKRGDGGLFVDRAGPSRAAKIDRIERTVEGEEDPDGFPADL